MKPTNNDRNKAEAGEARPLTVVYRLINDLKPDPANPRRHSKKQIRQIANSLKTFGFNVPILIDGGDNVIAGHGRLLAARERGMTVVPTLCLEHLTPAQARAFMIADNRLAEIAVWDDRLLAQQLKDLSLIGLDFNIEVIGFEVGEIDLRIASLEHLPEDDDDPADILPELSASPPLSKVGDVWQLDRHRVLCGSAPRCGGFRNIDGRAPGRDGFHRPALQRADRWARERARRDPSPPLPDGLGGDGSARIHRFPRRSFPESGVIQR